MANEDERNEGGISVENTDQKKRAILSFLKDFAALCESVEDSEDSPEYYDLVKKQIRQFRKKYTSLWACPFGKFYIQCIPQCQVLSY